MLNHVFRGLGFWHKNKKNFGIFGRKRLIALIVFVSTILPFAVFSINNNMPTMISKAADDTCTVTFYDTVTDDVYYSTTLAKDSHGRCSLVEIMSVSHTGYKYIGVSLTPTGTIVYDTLNDHWTTTEDIIYYLRFNKLPSYTLSFDANGGGGMPENQSCFVNSNTCSVTIPETIPTYGGRTFYGYAESASASEAVYQPGDNIVLSSNKTLYAIWVPIYTLSFDLRYGSFVGKIGECQPNRVGGSCEVSIINERPSRDGYTFRGWSTNPNTDTVSYHAGDTAILSSDVTIYAVWKKDAPDHEDIDGCNGSALDIDEAICLQDMNNAVKYTMQIGTEYELVDARDGVVYRVARLVDGNVWLLDNLRIGSDTEILLTLNDTNTNPELNNGEFILPASGDWENSYTKPAIDTTTADVMLGNDADKVTGGYYNYCAASAGTYCNEADEGEGDANYDICPAGWRMPTGGNGGEYQTLNNLYDDFINVMHLPLSGRFYSGAAGQVDQNGYFWSSTNRDGMRMYYLNRSNQTIDPVGSYRRDRGYSMRCVAKDVKPEFSCNAGAKNIDEAVCLQDVNAMVRASMEEDKTYKLVDSRDAELYRVAKLADGNVWLQDNLRIGGKDTILLTAEDTNTNPELNNGEFLLPNSNNWVDSYTEPVINTTDAHHMLGSENDKTQGGYYNYCAASAGTYCNEANEGEGDAEYDICPAGWRMPTGGNGGEYQTVDTLYDDLINALILPLSGRFYGGSTGQVDQNGYFWSSTNRDGMRMYYLNRSNQTIDPVGSYRRDRGYSMRCIVNIKESGDGKYAWKDGIDEHKIGGDESLTLIVNLSSRALLSVKVDGKILSGDAYDLESGEDTGIVLKKQYLDTLGVGKHQITVLYESGTEVTADFIISEEEIVVPDTAGPGIPNTGANTEDESGISGSERLAISVLIGLIVISFGLMLIMRNVRKSNK